MNRILFVLLGYCMYSQFLIADGDLKFNYEESYTEYKILRKDKTPHRIYGVKITPKFETDQSVGKRFAKLTDFHKHLEFIENVETTYLSFFSTPKWKAKLKKMQDIDKSWNISLEFRVNTSGKIVYSYFYASSRDTPLNLSELFTDQELYELYQVSKRVKYDLSKLTVSYTVDTANIIDKPKEDYKNKKYDYVKLGISFKDIIEEMIKAGVY